MKSIMRTLFMITLISLITAPMFAQTKGEKIMTKKVLIAYASKTGSTEEIVKFIKKTLESHDLIVDMKKADQVVSISGYQAVIVGSPIYMGSWSRESTEFVRKFQKDLRDHSLFYFAVGMSFAETDPKKVAQLDKYLEKEREMAKPLREGRFMGRMDLNKLSFFQKLVAKMVGAKNEDKRNWNAIKEWTENVYTLLP